MKAHTASLMNAVVLVGVGLWAYLGSEIRPKTALIPVGFGVLLAVLYPGVRKEHKGAAHVAVLLTLLILAGLVKPLTAAIDRDDGLALLRVLAMIFSTLVALFYFIKSFVDVRRARSTAARQEK